MDPLNLRLNVGSGKRRIPGYTNVDIQAGPEVDVVAPASVLPFATGTALSVAAIHVVEHVYPWEVPILLQEWHRVLAPGGELIIEMPDLLKAAANLVENRRVGKHPDQGHMWAIYGDDTLRDPYMMHKSGWWFDRLAPLVQDAGFKSIRELPTVFHPAGRHVRDFRLEATKC